MLLKKRPKFLYVVAKFQRCFGIKLVDRYCMCRCNREIVDHLLLHCDLAHALWSYVFSLFGGWHCSGWLIFWQYGGIGLDDFSHFMPHVAFVEEAESSHLWRCGSFWFAIEDFFYSLITWMISCIWSWVSLFCS